MTDRSRGPCLADGSHSRTSRLFRPAVAPTVDPLVFPPKGFCLDGPLPSSVVRLVSCNTSTTRAGPRWHCRAAPIPSGNDDRLLRGGGCQRPWPPGPYQRLRSTLCRRPGIPIRSLERLVVSHRDLSRSGRRWSLTECLRNRGRVLPGADDPLRPCDGRTMSQLVMTSWSPQVLSDYPCRFDWPATGAQEKARKRGGHPARGV